MHGDVITQIMGPEAMNTMYILTLKHTESNVSLVFLVLGERQTPQKCFI